MLGRTFSKPDLRHERGEDLRNECGMNRTKMSVSSGVSRREFLAGAAGVAAVWAINSSALFASAPSSLHFGYAEITWGDNVEQGIQDISSVGYPGIQLRANVVGTYEPAALAAELAKAKLTFVALSSGAVSGNPVGWD